MRRARVAGAALVTMLVTTGGLTACTREVEGTSVETISATQGLQEAEDFVASIAAQVSPGATVEDSEVKAGPDDCRSPQEGKVYYTIFKKFPAPDGAAGASAKEAVSTAVAAAGYTVRDEGDTGGWPTITGTAPLVGLRVLFSPDTPEVRFVVDTRCGTP